jgi:hypothetical protein
MKDILLSSKYLFDEYSERGLACLEMAGKVTTGSILSKCQ